MTAADFEAVASLLSSGHRFLLTGHRNPDGDSLGSALALAQALAARGKEARIVMRDRWSSSYDGMPGASGVTVSETLPPDWPAAWDAAIVMECPEAERPGFPELLSGTTVNIDHHPGNTRWATHNLVVLPAAAVGEIVADLLDRLEWPMTPEIATNLWVSLVSDTGSFRYGNTTPRALALGARLVTEGVRPDVVNEFLYEARPLSTVKLESLVLGTLELHDEGRVALVALPKRFLAESGADSADGEGLVNRARGIEGVKAAVLVRESDEPGVFRCSLRSKGSVDVRSVATARNGGGHRNAAGCRVSGTWESAKADIVRALAIAVSQEVP
jgi:bifunctional oligoribonuclease and PAP phosphatase NrnA